MEKGQKLKVISSNIEYPLGAVVTYLGDRRKDYVHAIDWAWNCVPTYDQPYWMVVQGVVDGEPYSTTGCPTDFKPVK